MHSQTTSPFTGFLRRGKFLERNASLSPRWHYCLASLDVIICTYKMLVHMYGNERIILLQPKGLLICLRLSRCICPLGTNLVRVSVV